jgi:SpoVK/Ycf46/Vps4 family AAA+-type ATPase
MIGRTDKLLRFPHAEVDTVLREIEIFWQREAVFQEFNLPYKRGILMYGPPGSGKTSALQLVARDVVDRGGIVLIWDTGLFTSAYRQIRAVQPETPIVVLMEDLDAILEGRIESAVLNVLDGAEEMHKVVFVATTNYPEKLGARIINRPSRFDKRIRVGHPDEVGRRMYLESLVEGHPELEIDLDLYIKDTAGMSIAHLKELFVATVLIGVPYLDALKHLRAMHLDKASSTDDDEEFVDRPGQYA